MKDLMMATKDENASENIAAKICVAHITQILEAYYDGKYNTAYIECVCGQNYHNTNAVYCGHCGQKLKKAAGDGFFG